MCLLREDVEALERLLLDAFPDLRFLWGNLWRRASLATADGHQVGVQQVHEPIPYIESLYQERLGWTMAWREPPGWRPVWGRREEAEYLIVLNQPPRRFGFLKGSIGRGGNPVQRNLVNFRDGLLNGRYAREDKEQKAFLSKVMRLLGKVATNKLAIFAPDSRTRLIPAKPGYVWAGYHAIEWCRQDPRRRLGGAYRPLEEVETGLPPLPPDPDG